MDIFILLYILFTFTTCVSATWATFFN